LTFGDSNAKKSVSVVGNTEKTFVLWDGIRTDQNGIPTHL
jgi:hypothetical protein